MLFFDGSKCLQGYGVGIMLVSPDSDMIPMAYNLNFECINNMDEYEALVLELKEVVDLGVNKLKVYGDSYLIINHINDAYNIKDEKLQPYRHLIATMVQRCFT